jgi:uncharacterized membrane protein YdjX (TVP38/TMEM64 family)
MQKVITFVITICGIMQTSRLGFDAFRLLYRAGYFDAVRRRPRIHFF